MSDFQPAPADARGLLRELRAKGVTLTIENDRLRATAPPGVISPELQASIRVFKSDLMALLGSEIARAESAEAEPARLSPAQERLWLYQQLEPHGTAYNLTSVVRIEGPLSYERLVDALRRVIERHEPLRSLVGSDFTGATISVVDAPAEFSSLIDMTHMSQSEAASKVRELVARAQSTPFDLGAEIPIRAVVVRLSAHQHELITTMHHIAVDGVSLQYFYRDLATFYDGAEPDPLRASYSQYAAWQRRYWTGDRLQERAQHWKTQLEDAPDTLDLPVDRPRNPSQAFTGGMATASLGPAVFRACQAFAQQERASLFMLITAAMGCSLYHHSGQRDIVVGTPLHGRERSEFTDLVGMFVNQLPVRISVPRDATFRTQVQRARSATLNGMADHEMPFGSMVESLGTPRDSSRNPIFQAMVNLVPGSDVAAGLVAGDVTFRIPPVQDLFAMFDGQAKMDLTLYAVQHESDLHLALVYNADIFSSERMASLLDDTVRVLKDGPAEPDARLSELMPVPARRLDVSGSREWVEPWVDESVAARFERMADRYADHIAVIDHTNETSYAELKLDVARVATLVASRTRPDAVIGVLIPHDGSIPAALLGVLRSGRTYLPLDARYPAGRLAFMVEDAGATAILTTTDLIEMCQEIAPEVQVILLSDDPESGAELPALPSPNAIAYLLYTSGSTSKPKAVVQTQRNLTHQAGRYAGALSISPADRVALLASISFDASLMDLFGALLTGAAIAPVDPRMTDLADLPQLLSTLRLSVLHVTPTLFRTIGRAAEGTGFPTIRAVDLGGERVRVGDIELFDRLFPQHAILVNSYGPSEHTFALGHIFGRHHRSAEIPIGAPLGDVEVVLMDGDGTEDPTVGEMVLRSEYGALRYWNRPELTERAFIADPANPGRTMYRTGDIVRRRPDGMYVYMHRADDQLKVRGYRIEPQEIESVLAQHPAIAEVAVHGPAGADGTPILTACIAWQGPALPSSEISAWCNSRVPSFMVPTVWLAVDALPRTPSGKVDRRNLPVGAQSGSAAGQEIHDAVESEVQQIWADVLGDAAIAMGEDFFRIGGNSLTAMQVVSRVRDVFDVEMPLRQFFNQPTVPATAAWIHNNRSQGSIMPAVVPAATRDHTPLSFSQERLWFLQQLDPRANAYNILTASLLEGPLDLERLRSATEAVSLRQESLRTRFSSVNGKPVQIVSRDPIHSFEVHDFTSYGSDGVEQARTLIQRKLELPYDLENDALFRILIVKLGTDRHAIGVGMHHTVSDFASYAIFGRELRAAYEGELPAPLPITYSDYAEWQRNWLQGEVLEEQVQYWRAQLDGLPALELATDFVRPPFLTFEGDAIRAELPPELLEGLRRFSAEHRATAFMTLLAAFNALMAAYSSQQDIAVGVPIAGRRITETQNLIGTFVNTIVHRNHLSPTCSFTDLVERVRATALDAYSHQDAPFEVLVRELNTSRDPSRSPLVQVLFNVANMRVDGFMMSGVMHTQLPIEKRAAQFDMSINVGLNEVQSEIYLTYNTSLFTRHTAQRMLTHYLEIVAVAVAHPETSIGSLTAPAHAEREALVGEWNDTARARAEGLNACGLFAQQAGVTPRNVAVESPSGSFTYAELLDYAQRVTAALQTMGIGSGDRVAIVMERTREMVGALIGILGAGAAYVPIDPNYPVPRVQYMLEDCGAKAIVAHRDLEKPYAPQIPVLDLGLWTQPPAVAFTDVTDEQPAYVIYTSGSTGKPKGVEIPHRAMVNFLLSMKEQPGISADDALLAVTTISFDIAVLELYLPLISGARVVIAGEEEALDGRRLIRRLSEAGVTIMQATPATWKLLIAAGWNGSPQMRALCGGEPLPRKLADDLLDRVGELWNMYGPTETTVWSTLDRVTRDDAILVGRPIANTTLYVLGDSLELRPIGVPGELYIGGAGVANGYVNRPDLTAERFIDSPFREGERLYRTGDLVRYRHDGRVEHLGRLDNQVKVRGFRIELGEVEAALQSHTAVRDAVVIASDDRLVGYVVLHDGMHMTATELRGWVGSTLPPYMVPSFVVPIDALPLTPNGKVDRKQLPDPTGQQENTADWVAPQDPAGLIIAEVWSTLLGVNRIGAGDNFFELGGHSLLAMEAVALIEERTGHRLEPRSMFFMTLGELAGTIPIPASSA